MKLPVPKIFSDAFKYLSASVVSKGIGFLVIPIYTRMFGVENYGEYSLFLIIYSFLSLFFEFGTVKTLTRTWYDYDDDDTRILLLYKLFSKQFLVNAIVSIILITIGSAISSFFKFSYTTFVFGVLTALVQLPIRFGLLYLQLSRRSSFYAFLAFANDGLIRLLSVLTIFFFNPFNNIIYNEPFIRLIIGAIISFFIFRTLPLRRIKHIQLKIEYIPFISASVFLMFHNISTLLLNLSDRLIINKFLSLKDTATFSLVYDVALIHSLILSAFATSYVPTLFKHLKSNEFQKVKKLNNGIVILITLLSGLLILFSKELIWFLGGNDYLLAQHLSYLNIAGVSMMAYYTLTSNVLIFNQKNLQLALSSFICACINIALNIILIPKYGIIAASITTLISYTLLFALTYSTVYYFKKQEINKYFQFNMIAKSIIVISLISILTFNIFSLEFETSELVIKLIVSIVIMLLLYKFIKLQFINKNI